MPSKQEERAAMKAAFMEEYHSDASRPLLSEDSVRLIHGKWDWTKVEIRRRIHPAKVTGEGTPPPAL